jgi:CBS domain-containing protein
MLIQAADIMTKDPAVCVPETPLQEVARMMVDHHCGSVPVVEDRRNMRLAGIITDRDIVCRAVVHDLQMSQATVAVCMSRPLVTVTPQSKIEEIRRLMEGAQVRRIPVVDEHGILRGIITQARIVKNLDDRDAAELIRSVSGKTDPHENSLR